MRAGTRLEIPAELVHLRDLRALLRGWLAEQGVASGAIADLVQATDECATNVIVHGYDGRTGSVEIELEVGAGAVEVRVRDRARPFDPTSVPEPADDRPLEARLRGGMGVHLMRAAVDEMRYRLLPDGRNEMTMIKRIERAD